MLAKFEKSLAKGSVKAPPSKSICHRLIISAALSQGESFIDNISYCRDSVATINCLKALGAVIEPRGNGIYVKGFDPRVAKASESLYCDESGSTLRFLIPIALLSGNEVRLCAERRLIDRPHGVYEDICREKGLRFSKSDDTITVSGPLCSGEYRLPGNVSSQFITGLLFALPLLEGNSKIILTTETESRSYIDLTLDAMAKFGVRAEWESESTLHVFGSQKYIAGELSVEGDHSGAAFTDAFNLFGGEVLTSGLDQESLQGDRVYPTLFKKLDQSYATVSIKDCPDLGPILFAIAAAKNGATFTDTKRLRIKESDRAEAMAQELRKFGATVKVFENSVIIEKSELHPPRQRLYGHNDHRIVMSLSVLLSLFGGEIDGAEAVDKSYEEFFEHIISLGIKVKLYDA